MTQNEILETGSASIKQTCQVCRLLPAKVKGRNSNGAAQWRCKACHDLKNRAGFTKGKL